MKNDKLCLSMGLLVMAGLSRSHSHGGTVGEALRQRADLLHVQP